MTNITTRLRLVDGEITARGPRDYGSCFCQNNVLCVLSAHFLHLLSVFRQKWNYPTFSYLFACEKILTLENTQIYLVFCSLIRIFADMKQRTEEEYYSESRRLRDETMQMADSLRDNPLRFTITNGITMDVEVTKSDLKTIVSKNTQDNRFNVFKNKLAQDIRGFLEKAQYEGWREVIPGKHPETAYFAYFSRELGAKAYLCVRKIKNTGLFKPYAIIDQNMFDAEIQNLRK